MSDTFQIEVVYCPPNQPCLIRQMRVDKHCNAGQAIEQSALLAEARLQPDLDIQIGIFGRQCTSDTPLKNLDRVEIYRPLLLSPTEARRLRAQTLAEK